jgi:hypothetical protein
MYLFGQQNPGRTFICIEVDHGDEEEEEDAPEV